MYVMLYQRDDGSETQINTFLSSWEEKTGEQYKFFVKRDESDGVEKVIEGKAIVPKNKESRTKKKKRPDGKLRSGSERRSSFGRRCRRQAR